MEYKTLRLNIEAGIGRIALSRPGLANHADLRLLQELGDACTAIAADAAICLAVVSADGPDFCGGWDEDTRTALLNDGVLDPFGCLARLPIPVLALLQGAVRGPGLELALACDVRVASEDARFSLPDVAAGGLPLAGGSQRLPRIAGRTTAASMLLLGEELDAAAAYRCGLISRVTSNQDLAAEAEATIARITANGPIALRYAKEAVVDGLEQPLDQALRYELDLSIILQTTRDRAEGVRAFLEKRQPRFEGR